MNKKRIAVFIVILIILAIVAIFSMRIYFLNQIGDIVSESILNDNYKSEYISNSNIQKIRDEAYAYENDSFKVNSLECSYDHENWIENFVWVDVWLNTNDGERAEHYKCYFRIEKGRVYITDVGISIAEDGSATDLD